MYLEVGERALVASVGVWAGRAAVGVFSHNPELK